MSQYENKNRRYYSAGIESDLPRNYYDEDENEPQIDESERVPAEAAAPLYEKKNVNDHPARQDNKSKNYDIRIEQQREYENEQIRQSKKRRKGLIIAILLLLIILCVLAAGVFFYYLDHRSGGESEVQTAQSYMNETPAFQRELADCINQHVDMTDAALKAKGNKLSEKDDEGSGSESGSYDPVTDEQSGSYERVINRSYPIPENWIAGTGRLASVDGGIQMESNAAAAANNMLTDMRKEGLNIRAVSGYRTDAKQRSLYKKQISKQGGNEFKAATVSAEPMTSEHQAGLAIDVSIDNSLEQSFGRTDQGRWLAAHCTDYGFILRYTKDGEKKTGVIYEPWHFRYVGSPETARRIADSGLTREEYYGKELKDEDITPYLEYLN